MKLYIYSDRRLPFSEKHLREACAHITEESDTSDLVTAVYFSSKKKTFRGTAYVSRWMTGSVFHASRGYWTFTRSFGTPPDLPARFRLIKLHLNPAHAYPRTERDVYGWRFTCNSLLEHTLLLFAHELHHFERHHLGLHAGEGEQAANRWALKKMEQKGYGITGKRLPPGRRKRRKRRPLLPREFARLRHLKAGDRVRITEDGGNRYRGCTAEVIRPARPNAKRMVIQTEDGKTWRWPMPWLAPE